MKKGIFCILCCLVAMVSCQKSGINAFQGDYSFKSSGVVSVQRTTPIISPSIVPPTFNFTLPNEIGQLEIRALDRREKSVVVVMNYMNDEVIVVNGTCDGQTITLNEFQRNGFSISVDSYVSSRCFVNVKAEGRIYDDNTIVFNMVYSGIASIANIVYNIQGDNIHMVATRN
jgi:hypothetical protein